MRGKLLIFNQNYLFLEFAYFQAKECKILYNQSNRQKVLTSEHTNRDMDI